MSYFAFVSNIVNGKGIVKNVIAISQDEVNTGNWGDPSCWYQTSYNTYGNVHYGSNGQPDGGIALRGNYAGIGDTYDQVNDVFYNPRPYLSWVLNTTTWLWEAPIPRPQGGENYVWDEPTLSWIVLVNKND